MDLSIKKEDEFALYPDHANSSEKLMNIADQALYQAKKVRNHYKYYNANE